MQSLYSVEPSLAAQLAPLRTCAEDARRKMADFIEWAVAEGVCRGTNVSIVHDIDPPKPGEPVVALKAVFGDEATPGSWFYRTKDASPEALALAEAMVSPEGR
jgi:hypothetical protein